MGEPLDSKFKTTDPFRGQRPRSGEELQKQWDRCNIAAFHLVQVENRILGKTIQCSTLVLDGIDTGIPAR